MNFPDPLSENRFKTAGDCPDFASAAEQNGTVPFAEAGFETISKLLHAADDAAPGRNWPPISPLPSAAAATSAPPAATGWSQARPPLSSLHFLSGRFQLGTLAPRSYQHPWPLNLPAASRLLPAYSPPPKSRFKSEAAALKSQADDLDRQLRFVRTEQHRQNLRDQCRSQFAQAAAADLVPSPQDQAALIALGQGDYYWQTRREEKPAEAAYQSILENYPNTRWAAVAKERLQQFQMN